VTRASLREYAALPRERYRTLGRREKRRLLDELVAVTKMHRKAAIRLLRRAPAVDAPLPADVVAQITRWKPEIIQLLNERHPRWRRAWGKPGPGHVGRPAKPRRQTLSPWPDSIPGLGCREARAYAPCNLCGTGSWV
jgi:hypothetical protein